MPDAGPLMERVRARDRDAFASLYDSHHRLVFAIASRMLGDPAAAEDVTQNVFLKVWTAPDAFAGGNFGAWIARVTRNRCLDVLRSRATRPEGEMPVDTAAGETTDEVVFSRLDGDAIRSALAQLPQEQRSPIEMGFFGGITHEEIARRTNVPLGTVKTRIRAGLRRLRVELEAAVNA